ncbi:MAG: hypothetical protein EBZ77_17580, partial [Chitinophagia bacterium]|nr:hypothetical protein [Chitinophagia bacterium]
QRLSRWKQLHNGHNDSTLVVIITSGGGLRSCYWTFNALQQADSLTGGALFSHTVVITGASGGMIGATYWRGVHDAWLRKQLPDPYDRHFADNMGKDLLNSIIFSMASVDLISPFNKINVGKYSYGRDRGYAMEQQLIANTDGLLNHNIGYYAPGERSGLLPQVMVNSTIVNDGRKLIISNQPASYLTQPEYSLYDRLPPIDAVDYGTYYHNNDPYNLRLATALRMNSTFPFVLPVVRLPGKPAINIMDAGLRDNFGAELGTRYLYALRGWISGNIKHVILLEVRDSREFDVSGSSDQSSLAGMVADPLFVIQNKWEAIQSYKHSYMKEYSPYFLGCRYHNVILSYVPGKHNKSAALNFH